MRRLIDNGNRPITRSPISATMGDCGKPIWNNTATAFIPPL